jgi:hypothetical protein
MQGLESKKHTNMLMAISQFEELTTRYGHIVPEGEDKTIRVNIAEFKGSYDYYTILLKELENCIGNYRDLQDSLQQLMFPYVRKMNTKARKKRN